MVVDFATNHRNPLLYFLHSTGRKQSLGVDCLKQFPQGRPEEDEHAVAAAGARINLFSSMKDARRNGLKGSFQMRNQDFEIIPCSHHIARRNK
jgi:hypothetical protein